MRNLKLLLFFLIFISFYPKPLNLINFNTKTNFNPPNPTASTISQASVVLLNIHAYPNPINDSNGDRSSSYPNSSVELTDHTISGNDNSSQNGKLQWAQPIVASYSVSAGSHLWYLQVDTITLFEKSITT